VLPRLCAHPRRSPIATGWELQKASKPLPLSCVRRLDRLGRRPPLLGTTNKAMPLVELFASSLASTTTHAHPLTPERIILDLADADGDFGSWPSNAQFLGMLPRVKRRLQPVSHSQFAENAAQMAFYHFAGKPEPQRNLLICHAFCEVGKNLLVTAA
jgi:hypothetical protein